MSVAERKRRIIAPSATRSSAGRVRATRLPAELIDRAAHRLEVVAALLTVTGIVAFFLHSVPGLGESFGSSETLVARQLIFAVTGGVSLVVLLTARLSRLPKRRMLDLGQLYFLDGCADLYALGCVAWYLLVGRDVFTGTQPMQVMCAHMHGEPDPPSSQTDQPIPPELEAAVMACLAKDRDDRPADADALASLLDAVPLAEPWTQARAEQWWAAPGSAASDAGVAPA